MVMPVAPRADAGPTEMAPSQAPTTDASAAAGINGADEMDVAARRAAAIIGSGSYVPSLT